MVGRLSGIRTQSGQTKINNELRKNYRLIGNSAGRVLSLRVIPWHLLTTEETVWKNLSQGSRIVPVDTMETEYTEQNIHIRIHKHNNKNT